MDTPAAVWLTPKQVAPRLHGVSVSLVYKLLRAGVIPATKVGAKWLVAPADLDAYLAAHRTGPPPDPAPLARPPGGRADDPTCRRDIFDRDALTQPSVR